MINNIQNNLPGPDKGLIDVLFGNSQAEGELKGAEAISGQEFMKLLSGAEAGAFVLPGSELPVTPTQVPVQQGAVPAQPTVVNGLVPGGAQAQVQASPLQDQALLKQILDQKNAAGSAQQNTGLSGQPSVNPTAVPATSLQLTPQPQTKGGLKAIKGDSKELVKESSSVAQTTADALTQSKAVAAQQSAAIALGMNGNQGPKQMAIPQNPKQGANPQLDAITAQANQKKIQDAAMIKALEMAKEKVPEKVVLQPIVVQMPIVVPMDMQSVEDAHDLKEFVAASQLNADNPFSLMSSDSKGLSFNPRSAVSSQDYVQLGGAEKNLGLLSGKFSKSKNGFGGNDAEFSGTTLFSGGRQAQSSDLSMILPQAQQSGFSLGAKLPNLVSADPVLMSPRGAIEISNPLQVASQVYGLAAKGGGEVRLKVVPENLGEITISVQSRNQKLDVKFEATNDMAKNALIDSLPELRQALRASQYDVGSIEVNRSANSISSGIVSNASSVFGAGVQSGGFGSFDGSMNYNHGQQFSDGGNSRGETAWDRYNNQRESAQQHNERRQHGYKRYQQYESA